MNILFFAFNDNLRVMLSRKTLSDISFDAQNIRPAIGRTDMIYFQVANSLKQHTSATKESLVPTVTCGACFFCYHLTFHRSRSFSMLSP